MRVTAIERPNAFEAAEEKSSAAITCEVLRDWPLRGEARGRGHLSVGTAQRLVDSKGVNSH